MSKLSDFHLQREAKLAEGHVPPTLAGVEREGYGWTITKDAFLLEVECGLRLLYRKGEGVTFARPEGVSDETVSLYFSGSVHGAIAWTNGLLPLHASAVLAGESVVAFSGDAEAGKSTLAAAMSDFGYPVFADDVLIVDTSDAEEIRALPGHKMLKLWGDAFALVGARKGSQVYPDMDKHFAYPKETVGEGARRLSHLIFLEEDDEIAIEAIEGAAAFKSLATALYRPEYARGAGWDHARLFGLRAALTDKLSLYRFRRPKDPERFGESLAVIRDFIARLP